jgi:hypothetical protein
MYVSCETPEQTTSRLQRVLARAELRVFEAAYAFSEYPVSELPASAAVSALALVRDEQVWSALVPAELSHQERFSIFSFHFPEGVDNSGFVGWLATELKQRLGTGVFVVCGQNTGRGGIFDYWGVPLAVGEQAFSEIRRMRKIGGDTKYSPCKATSS